MQKNNCFPRQAVKKWCSQNDATYIENDACIYWMPFSSEQMLCVSVSDIWDVHKWNDLFKKI